MFETGKSESKDYKKLLTVIDDSLEELKLDGNKLIANEWPLKTLHL